MTNCDITQPRIKNHAGPVILICIRLQIAIVIMIEWATNKEDRDCATKKGHAENADRRLSEKSLIENYRLHKLKVQLLKYQLPVTN